MRTLPGTCGQSLESLAGKRVLASNQKSIHSHQRVLLPFFICMVAGPACHPSLWYCEAVLEQDQEALSSASFPTAHLSPHVKFIALLPVD